MTIYLKLSGTKGQQNTALETIHPDIAAKIGVRKPVFRGAYTHKIAVAYFDQLTITPAVYSKTEVDAEGNPIVLVPAVRDGPFIMFKILDGRSLGALGANLTRKWQSGGAPVKFYGD